MEDAYQALVYLEAVRRIIGPTGGFMHDYPMLNPTSFLVAHAIELSLSSYLRALGKKGGLGNHDLKGRLATAEANGLVPRQPFRQCVIALDKSHDKMQFRYSRNDPAPFISPRDALGMVLPDVEEIYYFVVEKATGSRPGTNASPVGRL